MPSDTLCNPSLPSLSNCNSARSQKSLLLVSSKLKSPKNTFTNEFKTYDSNFFTQRNQKLNGLRCSSKSCQSNRIYRYSQQLFTSIILVLIILASEGIASSFAQRGLIKLCPPGDESFASAWQMACGMKRKRRSADSLIDYNTAMNKRSLNDAEYLMNDKFAINSQRFGALRQRRDGAKDDYFTYSGENNDDSMQYQPFNANSGSGTETIELPLQNEHEQQHTALVLLNKNDGKKNNTATKEEPKQQQQLNAATDDQHSAYPILNNLSNGDEKLIMQQMLSYRPPSITEMMMVCCRYGCSLRDLLPYCSPFGEWDFR